MNKLFLNIYDTLRTHRKLVCIATAIIMLICGTLALRMDYDEDISAFMPLDEQTEKYTEVFNNIVGQNKIAVIFSSDDGEEAIMRAMDAFGEAIARRDTCKIARNLQIRVDETAMMQLLQSFWQTYPILLGDDDYKRIDSLVADSNYARDVMEQNKQMLMLPTGGLMARSMTCDPLHLSGMAINRLQDLNVDKSYKSIDGYLFKDDAGIALLESPFGISESRDNKALQDLLDSCANDVRSAFPSVRISSIGAPLIAVTNASQIKSDSLLAVSLAVVLIILILIYSFRRASDLAWIAISVFAGWLFALGAISILRDGISLIVIGIGSVIIGIAVNYPLHFIEHLKHESNMREVLKEMIPPLLVGNITTVSAFLCLVLLDARAMRDLGLFGSLTLVGTILFVLICLPVLIKPRGNDRHNSGKAFMPGHLRLPQGKRTRRMVFFIISGLTLVFAYLSTGTSFDSNMQHINYMLPEQRENLKFLSSSIQNQNDSLATIYAVAEGSTLDEALRNNETMHDQLIKADGVRKTISIAGMMPSDSLRRARTARWQSFWERHPSTIDDIKAAAAEAGFAAEAFAPFYDLTCRTSHTEPDTTFHSLIGQQFIMQDANGYKIVNFVQVDKPKAEETKQQIASAIPPGCFVFSQSDVSNHLAEVLSESFDYIGFVCGFVVFAFLWLSLGSIELSIMAFLPLAVSWIWILGIMQVFDMQFNIVNIILATFIFGQGDDYTIFITEGLMYEYTTGKRRLEQYKNSVALSAIIMFIGIGTLIFSKHPAMRSLAEVAIIGMATVVSMAYYIPPMVFRWLTEKDGKRREYPVTLARLCASLFAITFFICGMFLLLIPYTVLVHRPLQKVWNGEKFYHKLLQRISHFVICHVPGVKFRTINNPGERFDKPAVIICNHQSHLDLMCLMQLSPKIIVLTNDWVWSNPCYGVVIHTAEFRPVSNGYDKNFPHLQDLVKRGYSIVVFPEGTRTRDGRIARFHKGAFSLAKALGVDILPVCVHGLYDVLPKHDFMLRKGSVTLEVCERMPYSSIKDTTDRELAKDTRHWYIEKYGEMRKRLETPEYLAPYIAYNNKYKVKLT